MANGRRRPVAPARRVVATVLGTVAVFITLFGAGSGSWAIAALGVAVLVLAVSLVVVSAVRGGARAWIAGSAHVVSASEPPASSTYGRCELQVVIDAPGLPAAAVKIIESRVPVAKWPDSGATLPIIVAVDDPRHVRVQWDGVLTHTEAAAQEAFGDPEAVDDRTFMDNEPDRRRRASTVDDDRFVYTEQVAVPVEEVRPADTASSESQGAARPSAAPPAGDADPGGLPRQRKPSPHPSRRPRPRPGAGSPDRAADPPGGAPSGANPPGGAPSSANPPGAGPGAMPSGPGPGGAATDPNPPDAAGPSTPAGTERPLKPPAAPAPPTDPQAPEANAATPGSGGGAGAPSGTETSLAPGYAGTVEAAGTTLATGRASLETTAATVAAGPAAAAAGRARIAVTDRPRDRTGAPSPHRRAAFAGADDDDSLAQHITTYPSARPGPGGSIHGVGVTMLVTDLARSIEFYRDMLGFHAIDTGEGNAVLASGDTRLVLRTVQNVPRVNRRTVHLNLEVGDLRAVYADLKNRGVKFTYGPRSVNRGQRLELWAASFRDPDGHGIALTQWMGRPAEPATDSPQNAASDVQDVGPDQEEDHADGGQRPVQEASEQ